MAYFHGKWTRNRGGMKRRPMLRMVGETIEEMLNVQRRWPESVVINWPPRGKDTHKSKSLPMLWIDADRRDILEALDSAEVDDNYLRLLTWFIREEFYRTRCGGMRPEVDRFFKTEIRGTLIRLLRDGSWVDHPENLGLKKLNARLEKIDLGRRSDLNFSSQQSAIQKYDPDFQSSDRADPEFRDEPEMDWEEQYRNGSKVTREEILSSRPWMHSVLVEKYGEP